MEQIGFLWPQALTDANHWYKLWT